MTQEPWQATPTAAPHLTEPEVSACPASECFLLPQPVDYEKEFNLQATHIRRDTFDLGYLRDQPICVVLAVVAPVFE